MHFLDQSGNAYFTVPKWDDLIQSLVAAAKVEKINGKPRSWLPKFQKAGEELLEATLSQIRDADIFEDVTLERISDGQLVFEVFVKFSDEGSFNYEPAERPFQPFGAINQEWVETYIGKKIKRLVVINGIAVELTL
jgi:hypothetical protein